MFEQKKKIKVPDIESEIQYIAKSITGIKLAAGISDFITYILSELSANIIEHSKTKTCVIGVFISPKEMKLNIEDCGIGIRNSYLQNKIFVKDDRTAIMIALNGISTKKLKERAFGLNSIRQLIEHQSGKMTIESGKCRVAIEKDLINFTDLKMPVKGVNINIQTKINPVNIYDIIK